jgi:hypothetical protein
MSPFLRWLPFVTISMGIVFIQFPSQPLPPSTPMPSAPIILALHNWCPPLHILIVPVTNLPLCNLTHQQKFLANSPKRTE